MDSDKIKETLNLPQTSFSMKAKLAQKEPEIIKRWDEQQLYKKILEKRKDCPPFVLHDGPPYANGYIHLGTTLNKILKDFIVRTKNMQGFRSTYVPGWDCHGLPIEIKVDQILGDKKKDMSLIAIREECKQYATKYMGIQRGQFKRLGVFGEWEEPYLTMNPAYEANVIRYLADFFAMGNVYKGKKPVYWCIQCKTALAEAEVEYKDHTSPSIYVKFPMISDLSEKYPVLKGKKVSVLIWTTTPWTLPANLAIAFHPDFEYAAFSSNGDVFIAAKRLVPVIAEEMGLEKTEILTSFPGAEMEGLKARHPFIDRDSVFVLADYVTLDQGTGAVHTAPGHGHEDYQTGLAYGLEIYNPVDDDGHFMSHVDKYHGMNVFDANNEIIEDLTKDGKLDRAEDIVHSYPHCWRCKSPVIFRATSQWFISMDDNDFRANALEEIKRVEWIPSWGEERISSMVAARPDWCISRQRSWGVPIPAFYCDGCGVILANETIARYVADIFDREGSNSWFSKPAEELLPPGTTCENCGSTKLMKEYNILDVWFESGSSHNILGNKEELPWPADVYIEGHDQYRGWFNSSLLVSLASRGGSPFKTCIIHGFVLDEQGRGMSKSMGNVIEPEEIISKNGAEILRLWVAMLNYKEDSRFGDETLQRLIEAYRKIRNTWRFVLGNIHDFDPRTEAVTAEEMLPMDRWILEKSSTLGRRVSKAYAEYEYHVVFHSLYNFFTVELSSYYLDVIKDRIYCSGTDSLLRKSAQTALFELLKTTLILMATILPFTTEEAWEAMPDFEGKDKSVHLGFFPSFEKEWLSAELFDEWEQLIPVRELVLKELELARDAKTIGNSLEAHVSLKVPESRLGLLKKYEKDMPCLFIVSSVEVEAHAEDRVTVSVARSDGKKCQRCWNYSTYVGTSTEFPDFCRRCEDVVREMG
jgi:isoleucyl-tRNA synthetase